MGKNNTLRLLSLFIACILFWLVTAALQMNLLWFLVVNFLSILMIYRYKNCDKKMIAAGILFGALCMPSDLIMGLSAILPYIAATAIFKNSKNKIFLYGNGKKNNFLITMILIFVVGGILGGINLFFATGSMAINPSLKWKWLFDALRAGVFEEIFFRMFFFAICVHVTNDQPLSRVQNMLCYGVMVIPHVLIHFTLDTFSVGNMIMLTLLFGIPFAWMQRRSNLISAIGSHAFVDLVRFCMLGM